MASVSEQQSIGRWSNLASIAATGTCALDELFELVQSQDKIDELAVAYCMAAVGIMACEAHRHVHGHVPKPLSFELLEHLRPARGRLDDIAQDTAFIIAYIQSWFTGATTTDPQLVNAIVTAFKESTPARRAGTFTAMAGYARTQLGELTAATRSALVLTLAYAPTPQNPHAHMVAAFGAGACADGLRLRDSKAGRTLTRCQPDVTAAVIWIAVRTVAASIVPGQTATCQPAPSCECVNGKIATELLSQWVTGTAAGVPAMRQDITDRFDHIWARSAHLAEHLVSGMMHWLAARVKE